MQSSATKFLLYFDILGNGSYTQLCPLNLDYDQGETLDSWFNLCYNTMNNVKTAIDPTWSTSFKFASTDTVAKFIIGKEFSTGTDAQVPVKIVNLLKGTSGKQITFTATLSNIAYSAVTEEVLQVDFEIKVASAATFVEADYSASI